MDMLSVSKICMTNILEPAIEKDVNINLKCYYTQWWHGVCFLFYNYMQFHMFSYWFIDRSRCVYQRCPIQLANPLVFPDLLMLPQSWMKCLCIYSEHSDITMYILQIVLLSLCLGYHFAHCSLLLQLHGSFVLNIYNF